MCVCVLVIPSLASLAIYDLEIREEGIFVTPLLSRIDIDLLASLLELSTQT